MLALFRWLMFLALGMTPGESAFVVETVTGPTRVGEIVSLDADGKWTFSAGEPVSVSDTELIRVRRQSTPLPSLPSGPQLVFANGDRLAADVLGIENGRVRIRAHFGLEPGGDRSQEMEVPLSALAVLWLHPPSEELARRWSADRRRRDVVRTRNGDERIGTVRQLKAPTAPLLIEEEMGRDTEIEAALIMAIAMNTDLARTLRPRGPYARLVLTNGSRIGLVNLTAGAVTLAGRTLFGVEVKIPLREVVAIDWLQGRAVPLSELKPTRYEHRPFLSVRWPYTMDRSVAGNELRLGGGAYDRGIGMHSESRMTFELRGRYQRFDALVGLDDRTGQGGRVLIQMLVDGKPRDLGFTELSSATGPKPIRLDIAGAREMTLVVEYGPAGDMRDHVNWVDAMLIR